MMDLDPKASLRFPMRASKIPEQTKATTIDCQVIVAQLFGLADVRMVPSFA